MNPLRAWQEAELRDFKETLKRALFASPRLGKTRMSIEYLKAWRPSSCLITAPKTVCPFWIAEAAEHGIALLDGFSQPVSKLVELLRTNKYPLIVVNDDRLKSILDALPNIKFEALICDEAHRLKAVSSQRAKAYRKLAKRAKYVRILTGTPTPNHYGNLWSMMSPLSEEDFFSSYSKFSARYLITDQIFRSKIIGYRNLDELETKLKKWSTVVKREDVFGQDTWQIVEREVRMPQTAVNLYKKLAKEWIVEAGGQTVNATHGLTRLLRFQQITSGFVNAETGVQELHTAKIDAVCDDLEEIIESGEKAVVFCKFTWEIETYKREIEKRIGCKIVTIQGSSSVKERQEAISEINTGMKSCVCIVQIQAGSTGISLAGATHTLFVSETFSYTEQTQARDRIYSPGKNKCVTYYRCPGTIDSYIARTLALKKNVNDSVANMKLEEILFSV